MKIHRKYGWRRSHPDARNLKFKRLNLPVPDKVDWSILIPPAYDQLDMNSCLENAIAGAIQFLQSVQKEPLVMPSRLFMYYNVRVMENTVDSDAGGEMMDGIKSVNRQGVCPEADWPYDDYRLFFPPTPTCYSDASKTLLLKYQSVDNTVLETVLEALAYCPVLAGFSVYDSFESDAVAKTGMVPMPDLNTESVQGGHAVLIVGYDQATKLFKVRNSWSPQWGKDGYCFMPYAYLTDPDLAADFWICQKIT